MSPTVSTDLERMTRDRNSWRSLAFQGFALLIVMACIAFFTALAVHRCIPQPCVQPKADDPWQVPGAPADLPEGM